MPQFPVAMRGISVHSCFAIAMEAIGVVPFRLRIWLGNRSERSIVVRSRGDCLLRTGRIFVRGLRLHVHIAGRFDEAILPGDYGALADTRRGRLPDRLCAIRYCVRRRPASSWPFRRWGRFGFGGHAGPDTPAADECACAGKRRFVERRFFSSDPADRDRSGGGLGRRWAAAVQQWERGCQRQW